MSKLPGVCYLEITLIDIFPNGDNLEIANWQIATDTLIAILKAKSQNFPQGFEMQFIFEKGTKYLY